MTVDVLILVTVGLPVVIVLAAWAAKSRRDTQLATTGRHVIGRVLETGYDSDPLGGGSYWVSVEFACDGELTRAKVVIRHRDRERYHPGQRVGLTYLPRRPHVAELDPPEWTRC